MLTDQELALQSRQGNGTAFQEIVRRYIGPIYNFLLRLSRNPQNAEDLTQETFVKAWRHIKKFDLERNFNTWLFTIARRTALDMFKKKRPLVFSDFENEEGENILLETLDDPSPPPDLQAEREETRRIFEEALNNIPARYREILLLRHVHDLTFEEIASVTEKPANTVRSLHRRGLLMLKKEVAPEE